MEAFNLWLKVDGADLAVVKELVGMLHNASLLYAAQFGAIPFVVEDGVLIP